PTGSADSSHDAEGRAARPALLALHTLIQGGEMPRADRPMIPEYGVPDDDEGLLPFSHLEAQLGAAHDYWVASVRPDGRPHAVPVWGVWLDGTLYFGGGKQTRKARNLDRNPDVVVHTGSASDVAIIEGRVREVTDAGEQ